MVSDPQYDEDTVNLGYLKRALNNETKEVQVNNTKNHNIEPEPPYHIGDTWTQGPNGMLYRCIKDRTIGKFDISDWEIAVNYTNDNTANEALQQVQLLTNQVDGKIESYYQSTNPANNFSTTIEKEKHVGDLWHNTESLADCIFSKENGKYFWREKHISEKLFNTDGSKKTIFTEKPNDYKVNDAWILSSYINEVDLPDNCNISQMVFATKSNITFDKNDWEKKPNYTTPNLDDMSNQDTKEDIENEIENVVKPSILQQSKDIAKELIDNFNKGYFIKDETEGCVYILDNPDITKAVVVGKWGLGGLAYSMNGKEGDYEVSITADGKIVANAITTGTMSASRIKGGVLTLGGFNDINGRLTILDRNNQEMVIADVDGLKLKNGAKIIGSNGIISILQFNSEIWKDLGMVQQDGWNYTDYCNLFMEVYIPDNFTIMSGFLKLRHAPYKYTDSKGQLVFYGFSRNINLYSCASNKIDDFRRAGVLGGEYIESVNIQNYSKIINALGGNGWTPIANSANENVQEKNSIDLTNYIRKGMNRLMIKSDEPIPSEELYNNYLNIAPMRRTGIVTAYLTIVGFTS